MPVDKGGIDYPIRAFDEFGAVFADFRAQVAANRQEWAAFRAETAKGGVSASRVNASLRSLQAQAVALSGVTQQLRIQAQAVAALNAVNKGTPVSSIKIDNSVKQFIREAPAQFREANVEATKFNSSLGRIVRALVLFAAIRQAGSVLAGFVGGLVKFNSEIENVTLGIAAVVTAVGTVRTAAGGAVTATAALALGQKEAARQTRLLRQDALSTTASFEDLALAFQTAIAPGLNAGLNLDQVRKFAVQISQAATAIGLSQNQLAEEIRSILAGTIQARTTRIATALGITNEDIRRAKEAGTLADFLNKRFSAFTEAGKEAQTTFTGLTNRLKTGFQLVLSSGGLEYFNKVKALLADLFNIVATKNPLTGIIEPNPTAILFVQEIAKGLSAAVDEVNRLRSVLTAEQVVGFATTIGQGIKTFVTFLGAAIEGVIRASNALQPIFLAIFNAFNNNPGLAKLVTGLVAALVLSKAISFAFGEVGSVLGIVATTMRVLTTTLSLASAEALLTVGSFKSLQTIGLSLSIVVSSFLGSLLLAGVFVSGLVIVTQSWLSSLTGVDLKLSTIAQNAGKIKDALIATAAIELALANLRAKQEKQSLEAGKGNPDGLKSLAKTADQIRQLEVLLAKLKKNTKDFLNGENDKNPTFLDAVLSKIDPVIGPLKKKISGLFDGTPGDVGKLSKALADLPPVISRSSDALAQNGKLLETLTEKAEKLKDTFATTKATTGLSGAVLEEFRASADAADELRSSLRGLTAEQLAAQGSLLETQKKRVSNQIALGNVNDKEKSVVEAVLGFYHDIEDSQVRLAALTTNQVLNQQDLLAAQKSGDTDAIKAAKDLVESTQEKILQQEKLNKSLAEQIDLQVESVGSDRAAALKKLILDRVQLEGQEKGILADINSLTRGRSELEALAARNVALQQAATAEAEIFKLRRDTSKIILEADQAEAEFALRNARDEERTATFSQIKLALSRLAVEQAEILRQKEVATLESLIAQNEARRAALTSTLGNDLGDPEKEKQIKQEIAALDQAISSLEGQKGSVIKQNTELRRKETEELKLQTAEVEKARIEAEIPVGAGIVKGLAEAFKASELSFQNTVNFMRSTVESFSAFVSSQIVDAFDPNSNTDAQERFAAFLRGLAAQIIQTLVTLAITAAALNAASDGLLGPTLALYAKSQGFNGFFKGGRAGDAFQHAEGRAAGGRPTGRRVHGVSRPRGLHPRDTVPIWADPSEWIITGSVTQKLGDAFMQKLNNGELDPMALRAFAGVSGSSSRTARAESMGMVLGGSVAEAAAASAAHSAAQSNALSQGTRTQGSGGVVAAYIQPGPGVASGLMKGDVNGVLRFLSDNRRDVKGALGVQ